MEFFQTHQHALWFSLGFLLLVIELLVFSFSTGFVFFLGLAALLTGGLIWGGLIPHTWLSGVASFGISSVVISVLLYKPLKKMQNNDKPLEKDHSSDMIGLEFRLEQDIDRLKIGSKRYSGIEWKVELDKSVEVDSLPTGTLVKVVAVDVARFWVAPV